MTNLMNKLTSAVSNVVLFAVAIAMAGLGFVFVGTLALFSLMAFGIALIAVPFVGAAQAGQTEADDADDVVEAEAEAVA